MVDTITFTFSLTSFIIIVLITEARIHNYQNMPGDGFLYEQGPGKHQFRMSSALEQSGYLIRPSPQRDERKLLQINYP